VLGAAVVSAVVAGPLGGLLIATGTMLGYPVGHLADTPGAMLVLWGMLTGFLYASLPAAVFGAGLGQYVRRGLAQGKNESALRFRAAAAGGALGGIFGVGLYLAGGAGAPLSLPIIAGVLTGAICGVIVTSIVTSDHRADARAAHR
jgi:hypothetical protein